ncbi:MAG: deoxyribonuclease IV [Abditibacteriota bacterium]|nr:deoxyribonuclease IV [Abditibacteriota bacterium]MBP5718103.1 deoxyribonuclease IV [Abditibacteriota bacterium]
MNIGCHLSVSKGFLFMGRQAESIGANTLQFFTRNPRGSKAKPLDPEDARAFVEFCKEKDFGMTVAHAPYTLNPCSSDPKNRDFARLTMADDLARLEYTPNAYYNFHPGSHTGQGIETGIEQIAETLNAILSEKQAVTVLLETMSGKGSEVGSRFEELAAVIDKTEKKSKIGVCLDTCHVYDAGYDIVGDLDGVLARFDDVIGLDRLKAVHVNDSMNPMGSHKDRHAKIGEGHIGADAIARVINHPKLAGLPFVLETPNELDGYRREIALLRELS